MVLTRRRVRNEHGNLVIERNMRSSNALCSKNTAFELLPQQRFLRRIVRAHAWDRLMLYHAMGSGKTCSAITIAFAHLDRHPDARVIVILPARLRTNFMDELRQPCARGKYVSRAEAAVLEDDAASPSSRKAVLDASERRMKKTFRLWSMEYDLSEKFKRHGDADKAKRAAWARAVTGQHTLVIVDEVHNVLSESKTSNRFVHFCEHADPTAKFVFMSGTPIVDNAVQLRKLVRAIVPAGEIDKRAIARNPRSSSRALIDALRGRVSFYGTGAAPRAFPSVVRKRLDVVATPKQVEAIKLIRKPLRGALGNFSDPVAETRVGSQANAFWTSERQASIVAASELPAGGSTELIGRLKAYAPKIRNLLHRVDRVPGKHLVYCSFVKGGLDYVEAVLRAEGYANAITAKHVAPFKGYAVWTGDTSDAVKTRTKHMANAASNKHGRELRIVLMSEAAREGISFKHVQAVHLLDPVWNRATQDQILSRAVRRCSHADMPPDLRSVRVYTYVLTFPASVRKTLGQTADERIVDVIARRKFEQVKKAEVALRKVAVDHLLFRKSVAPGNADTDNKTNTSFSSFDVNAPKRVARDGAAAVGASRARPVVLDESYGSDDDDARPVPPLRSSLIDLTQNDDVLSNNRTIAEQRAILASIREGGK